jgi:hypothetical protein
MPKRLVVVVVMAANTIVGFCIRHDWQRWRWQYRHYRCRMPTKMGFEVIPLSMCNTKVKKNMTARCWRSWSIHFGVKLSSLSWPPSMHMCSIIASATAWEILAVKVVVVEEKWLVAAISFLSGRRCSLPVMQSGVVVLRRCSYWHQRLTSRTS